MFGVLFGLVAKTGLAEKFVKPVTYVGLGVAALIAFGVLKSCYDSSVIENAVNKSNAEFGEKLNEATGKADVESDERQSQFNQEIKQTEDLIDEANQKGCAVADYLNSNGCVCVRTDSGEVRSSCPE